MALVLKFNFFTGGAFFHLNIYEAGTNLLIIIGALPLRGNGRAIYVLPLQQICAICSLVKWCSKAGRRRRRHLGQLVSFFTLCITEKRCGLCALCLLTRVMRTQNTLVLYGDTKLGACWCTSFLSQHYIRARQSGFQSLNLFLQKRPSILSLRKHAQLIG
jgi:hypothetical protein